MRRAPATPRTSRRAARATPLRGWAARWLPCAIVGGATLLPLDAAAGERLLYETAVQRINEAYLHLQTLDAGKVLLEAAEAAEADIPWLIVESAGPRAVKLRHGERGPLGTITVHGEGLSGVPLALNQLEDALRAANAPLPEHQQLSVELTAGMAAALDRFSTVLHGSSLESFDERIKGLLVGIGTRTGQVGDAVVIKEVFPSGPAEAAGLLPGDKILRIDGVSTLGAPSGTVSRLLRGDANTEVVLQIERMGGDGIKQVFDAVLVRREVMIPNVHNDLLANGVLHVQIDHFSDQTVSLVRRGLQSVPKGKLNGVVIDLRGNGGGSMLQACRVADLFLKDGLVLSTRGRDGKPVESLVREYYAHDEGDEPLVPVVVLIDERSASASEILAGALALRERAVLLGQRTHGKGTVQKVYTLRGGEERERVRIKLTVAEYRLPGDVPIAAGVGLAPDLWVEPVILDQGGAVFPDPEPDVVGVVEWLDERKGWRGRQIDRGDVALDVASGVIGRGLRRTDRASLLAAAEAEAQARQPKELALLVEALAARGIDWRADSVAGDGLPLEVRLSFDKEPRAGELAELRAHVENVGKAPLHRVMVRVQSEDQDLGLDGAVLPVGYLPPGEHGLGSVMVRPNATGGPRWTRLDPVASAAGRPDRVGDGQRIKVGAPPPPPLSLLCRYSVGPAGAKVSVEVENNGATVMKDLRLKLALPEDAPVELLKPEATLARLEPGQRASLDLPVRARPGATRLRAEARVYAEPWGRVLNVPLDLAMDGRPIQRRAPTLAGQVPLDAPAGAMPVKLEISDDKQVRSVTAWLDNEKLAWTAPLRPKAELPLRLDLSPGAHSLTVEAEDDDGIRSRRTWWVHVAGEDATYGLQPDDPGEDEGGRP